jgi:hypothetical protein
MDRTDDGVSESVVAWIYDRYREGVGWQRGLHSYGCHAWDCDTTAGHFSSSGPYLSHHQHP